MKDKPIVIVAGEPYSIFFEIFLKSFKKKVFLKFKNPIILICSRKLFYNQMKKFGYNFNINDIFFSNLSSVKISNNKINILNVDFNFTKTFDKISIKSNKYIYECFSLGFKIVKKFGVKSFVNGPISKKFLLNKKFPGMTEFFASETKRLNKQVMLIYNKKLAVSPISTHIPIKNVVKKISKKKIILQARTINGFYKKNFNKKPRIAVTGLNPHCETQDSFSEEDKIISPAIRKLKKEGLSINGPYPADTIFLKKNLPNFDVIIGMYHDQVLTPIKALYGFNAINITLGLPFLRITPDHGTNNEMLGKNYSSPDSLIEVFKFIKKTK